MAQQPHDTPTSATAEGGEVMLDGPGGLATSMTPKAAVDSAEAIRTAAEQALQQTDKCADAA